MVETRRTYVDLATTLVLCIASVYFYCHMDSYIEAGLPSTVHPLVFPRFILSLVLLCGVLLVLSSARAVLYLRRQARVPEEHGHSPGPADREDAAQGGRGLCVYAAILLGYCACFDALGFLAATPLAMLAVSRLLGNTKTLFPLLGFAAFSGGMEQLFLRAVKLPLPQGILAF